MTAHLRAAARAARSRAMAVALGVATLVLIGPAAAWAAPATPAPSSDTPSDPSVPAVTNAHPTSTQGDGKGLPHWLWVSGLAACALVIIAVGMLALRGARDREERAG